MRHKTQGASVPLAVAALLVALAPGCRGDTAPYSWQQPHARVLPTGDLEWAPEPFTFAAGDSVRYIDFAGGGDANPGTRAAPWKHHPWDAGATANAKACRGAYTYVFRRGVVYRGALVGAGSGEAGSPIRLTSDPSWGEGEACLYGSEVVTGWQPGGHAAMPEAGRVWHADLGFAPRLVCVVSAEGAITRLKLARTPNWEVTDPDDVLGNCWSWENPEWWQGGDRYKTTVGNTKMHLGVDTRHLTGDAATYVGGLVWSEWGIVMGAPYATPIEAFDPQRKAVAFQGPWFGDSASIHTNNRYWLEDRPHYLDQPGEFWFDKQGAGGRLYVRLPGDADPSTVTVEAARHGTLIDSRGMSHIEISGLTFRFGNVYWDLGARTFQGDVETAAVRLVGSGTDLSVHHCRFEHLAQAIRLKAGGDTDRLDEVRITDNDIAYTDHGAIEVLDGTGWAQKYRPGSLGRVAVLRNRLREIGFRPYRPNGHMAVHVNNPEVAEIAGNLIERCGASGLFIHGGKANGALYDAPFARLLIHHNKVVDSLLLANDWGGIETWQGGPFYVYDNVSGNPVGPFNWTGGRFGHAYYLDGSSKNYLFNNIAWGKANDPGDKRRANTSAFQEIHGYQNTFFGNTAWRFLQTSRRQAPQAGRNRYLGNVLEDSGELVFRHSDKEGVDPNARDAGTQAEAFAYDLNAYSRNVLAEVKGKIGVFEAEGGDHADLASFAGALGRLQALASDVGVMAPGKVLRDPERLDFRLRADSPAVDEGVRVFVPWGLHATVGEYHFIRNQADPTLITDESWYMKPHMIDREGYHKAPTYPLRAANVTAADYVASPTDTWAPGALRLNGRDQYLVLPSVPAAEAPAAEVRESQPEEWVTVTAPGGVSPDVEFEVALRLRGIPDGARLSVDLNWLKPEAFGGFLTVVGRAEVRGPGPYTFRCKAPTQQGLARYVLTMYVSPDGAWESATHRANVQLDPVAAPVAFDPQIANHSFVIECLFRTEPGSTGLLVQKLAEGGYSLQIAGNGRVAFSAGRGTGEAQIVSRAAVNDGEWHHLIVEGDRPAKTLALYLDGKQDAAGPGLDGSVSLASSADLLVGGGPGLPCLAATLDFLRLSRGTLADARTTIDELYAWQFDGPQFRDFCGNLPVDRRDAGALELMP